MQGSVVTTKILLGVALTSRSGGTLLGMPPVSSFRLDLKAYWAFNDNALAVDTQ